MLDHDHDKCVTTQEFNYLTVDNFAARLALANLVTIADIADLAKEKQFENILKRC